MPWALVIYGTDRAHITNGATITIGSNKPLAMNSEELPNILTYYHLHVFSSGRESLLALEEDNYGRNLVAPVCGIKRSTFFDTFTDRGVEQLLYVFSELQKKATAVLPSQSMERGDLIAIDGSLIDSVFFMHLAEYQSNSKKAKLHLDFNLNQGVPRKLFLTEGNGAERPFVSQLIDPGQTDVLDRGYQAHHFFDQWQNDDCHFARRVKGKTKKEVLQK